MIHEHPGPRQARQRWGVICAMRINGHDELDGLGVGGPGDPFVDQARNDIGTSRCVTNRDHAGASLRLRRPCMVDASSDAVRQWSLLDITAHLLAMPVKDLRVSLLQIVVALEIESFEKTDRLQLDDAGAADMSAGEVRLPKAGIDALRPRLDGPSARQIVRQHVVPDPRVDMRAERGLIAGPLGKIAKRRDHLAPGAESGGRAQLLTVEPAHRRP